MNYMKQIGKLLGVAFGEYFHVTWHSNTKFVIIDSGMFYYDEDNNKWERSLLLYDILLGDCTIEKIPGQESISEPIMWIETIMG